MALDKAREQIKLGGGTVGRSLLALEYSEIQKLEKRETQGRVSGNQKGRVERGVAWLEEEEEEEKEDEEKLSSLRVSHHKRCREEKERVERLGLGGGWLVGDWGRDFGERVVGPSPFGSAHEGMRCSQRPRPGTVLRWREGDERKGEQREGSTISRSRGGSTHTKMHLDSETGSTY